MPPKSIAPRRPTAPGHRSACAGPSFPPHGCSAATPSRRHSISPARDPVRPGAPPSPTENPDMEGGGPRSLQVAERNLDQRLMLKALRSFKRGDFSFRLPLDLTGIDGEIAASFN